MVGAILEDLRPREWIPFSTPVSKSQLFDFIENNQFASEVYDYFSNYQNASFGDLRRISTYGLAKRNGKEYIVILDSGLSDEVYNKYYRRRWVRNWWISA